MRTNSYQTVQGWFDDLVKVFENAMEYNENGSRIYKDGKLLLVSLFNVPLPPCSVTDSSSSSGCSTD